jgi:neopullulanase
VSGSSPTPAPGWVKDAVFYQIFPDRFARSDRQPSWLHLEPWNASPTVHGFKGGDLWGVLNHLDHLQDLGVTAIYFNPIFQSAANHRYHTHDYYQVDPLLGGDQAFEALLKEMHRRGMQMVLDGVFNHASRGFFPFNHLLENGPASPYLNWFSVKGFPLHAYDEDKPPSYDAWWNLPALPKLNTDCPGVRTFLWDVAEHWIRRGIDGWRLDVPHEIDDDAFWQEFRCRVKEANPEAYIVGELWGNASRWLQGDQFDAVMNYAFTRAVLGYCGGSDLDLASRPGGYSLERLDAPAFGQRIRDLLQLYRWDVSLAQLNLLGSHDTPRFINLVGGRRERLKLATLLQMCYPGAPCIYYGDEVGVTGGPDPDCRKGMPWSNAKWDLDLWTWFKDAVDLRRRYPSLRSGELHVILAQGQCFGMVRRLGRERVAVVFNLGNSTQRIELTTRHLLPDRARLTDVWGPANARDEMLHVHRGAVQGLSLPPLSARILVASDDQGESAD